MSRFEQRPHRFDFFNTAALRKAKRAGCCNRGRSLRHESLEDRRMLALVGIQALLDQPLVSYNSDGQVGYDSVSDEFSLNATPLIFLESATDATPGVFFTGDLDINIEVDAAGSLIGGSAGDDFILTGDLDTNGDFVPDLSGVLLTGEVSEFGWQDLGTSTDNYDFRFTVTGGLLAPGFFAGRDIGVSVVSENSSFTGAFSTDFGGDAKGILGGVPEIPPPPQFASLSGVKYYDLTGDGITDDDTPLAGVTINLYADTNGDGMLDGGDVLVDSDETGVDGAYEFEDLDPGDYLVEEVVPEGYVATSPVVQALALAAGEDVTTGYDFSNTVLLAGLTGVKTAEVTVCDCDGVQTIETETVSDLVINLYADANGNGLLDGAEGDATVATTTTGADGSYVFDDLLPGDYIVEEVVPEGYVALTATSIAVTLAPGAFVDQGVDFKNKLVKASVGNYFFVDANSNGLQDTGDLGVNGVTVNLLDDSGQVVATTVTANDGAGNAGFYLFFDLSAGDYIVEFEVPDLVQFTTKDAGGNSNDTLDSDANSNGRTDVFSLAENQHRRDIDAGVKPEVCVETKVYKVKDYFTKCQKAKAGLIKGVTLEYAEASEELFVEVQMKSYRGRLADGFTIVINNGGAAYGADAGELAMFYFDATRDEPVLNVLAYNGEGDASSYKDSDGRSRSYDPDRVATSYDNTNGWLKEIDVENNGSYRTFSFRVDASVINDHLPLRNIDWQGSEIDRYASFAVDTYDGLSTRYDNEGFLTKWSYCTHGWMDACNIRTQKCTVEECVAIDEFFDEWGWETSDYAGDSDGDPLDDIFWEGSIDACHECEDDCDKGDHDKDCKDGKHKHHKKKWSPWKQWGHHGWGGGWGGKC
ncbi:Serine-aspartate repeat-containing protein F precursor [Pseudobythopirellula maris]|uniref:Serine-aspartate repeat-containing protein F n=1 Tax=Pseudobythopirellula maris TaxID=2527991 RepID=A0A5C5ZSL3_9BACT|nr:SdrD B-like domain-containing protein [Pseudobythopirellula maris]TWT90499.1 Serine-aspartate repeat-containing protein F precursor [Pseudobythopirellula maris]